MALAHLVPVNTPVDLGDDDYFKLSLTCGIELLRRGNGLDQLLDDHSIVDPDVGGIDLNRSEEPISFFSIRVKTSWIF